MLRRIENSNGIVKCNGKYIKTYLHNTDYIQKHYISTILRDSLRPQHKLKNSHKSIMQKASRAIMNLSKLTYNINAPTPTYGKKG